MNRLSLKIRVFAHMLGEEILKSIVKQAVAIRIGFVLGNEAAKTCHISVGERLSIHLLLNPILGELKTVDCLLSNGSRHLFMDKVFEKLSPYITAAPFITKNIACSGPGSNYSFSIVVTTIRTCTQDAGNPCTMPTGRFGSCQ